MQTKHQRRSLWSWYLLNLLAWGFVFSPFYLFPKLSPSIADRFGDAVQLGIPLLVQIICVGLTQWLMLRHWKVKFDVSRWIAANILGVLIAVLVLFMIGLFVGTFQRLILAFLHGEYSTSAQTDLILKLISIGLPLLGSVGASVIVAIDMFKWKSGKNKVVEEE